MECNTFRPWQGGKSPRTSPLYGFYRTRLKPPPMPENNTRTSALIVRVTAEEKETLRERAANKGLSVSDYMRERLLNISPLRKRRIPRADEKALALALGHLMRIGNNVNQMAHALNIAKSKPDAAATAEVLSRNQKIIGEMHTAILESRDLITKALLNHDLEG